MNTLSIQCTDSNKTKYKPQSLIGWIVLTVVLAALMFTASPALTGHAMVEKQVGSNCGGSLYWETLLAGYFDAPMHNPPDCQPIAYDELDTELRATLYWENILPQIFDAPLVAQNSLVPVTGKTSQPQLQPSLYWEYFFANQ